MHIIQIAAELAPIAKVGGLGDVVSGLSRQLQKNGHHVEIIIPKYDVTHLQQVEQLQELKTAFPLTYDGHTHQVRVWKGQLLGVTVFFLDSEHPHSFFKRGCIYSCLDDMDRFLYFSLAALEFIHTRTELPDIIHAHDWQTGIIAPLYINQYRLHSPKRAALVHTLHNLEHQGVCDPGFLHKVGLDPEHYMCPDRLQDPLNASQINLLKGSIVYSDAITTVSPTYAEEVKSQASGRALESILIQHTSRFSGILNGLDCDYWNPKADPYLPAHFGLERGQMAHGQFSLRNKRLVKQRLQTTVGLEQVENKPLVAVISRLVPQKGIHLIRRGLYRTLELDGQFILLGSSPIPQVQAEFEALKEEFSQNPSVHIEMVQSESLAHLIFGGSDIFLVPSLFEPCGLTQLIAMRYGSIPVVRSTGGLSDTVFDVDYADCPVEERNGYCFEHTDDQALDSALDRAMNCWKSHPEIWWQLVRNAMSIDHSWKTSAKAYEDIYKGICHQQTPQEV